MPMRQEMLEKVKKSAAEIGCRFFAKERSFYVGDAYRAGADMGTNGRADGTVPQILRKRSLRRKPREERIFLGGIV